jgi:hypothetical protein
MEDSRSLDQPSIDQNERVRHLFSLAHIGGKSDDSNPICLASRGVSRTNKEHGGGQPLIFDTCN